jgi:hypothetical protein
LKLDKIDIRAMLHGVSNVAYLDTTMKMYKEYFPTLPSKFPIYPGKYFARNVTIITNQVNEINMTDEDYKKNTDIGGKIYSSITPTILPNGYYRHIIRFYSDEDSEGFCLFWHTELNLRMNAEDF